MLEGSGTSPVSRPVKFIGQFDGFGLPSCGIEPVEDMEALVWTWGEPLLDITPGTIAYVCGDLCSTRDGRLCVEAYTVTA